MKNEVRSIYVDKTNVSLNTVANYAMELTTVENLISCGITSTNGINLQDRKAFLLREIESMERSRNHSFTYPRN